MDRKYLSVLAPAHSLVNKVTAASPASNLVEFDLHLARPALSWVGDHIVGGKTVLPGAAFLEAALAAGMQLLGSFLQDDLALAAVSFVSPLVLQDVAGEADNLQLTVQVQLHSGAVVIVSHQTQPIGKTSGGRVTHISGTLIKHHSYADSSSTIASGHLLQAAEADSSFDRIAAKGLQPLDVTVFYKKLASSGLAYGPSFRLLSSTRAGLGHAAAQLLQMPSDGSSYLVHPAALDAGFQLGAAVQDEAVSQHQTYVPAALQLFSVGSKHTQAACWQLESATALAHDGGGHLGPAAAAGAGKLIRDVQLSLAGKRMCNASGLESRASSVLKEKQQQPDMLYAMQWLAESPPAAAPWGRDKQAVFAPAAINNQALLNSLHLIQSSMSHGSSSSSEMAAALSLCLDSISEAMTDPAGAVPGAAVQLEVCGLVRSAAQEAAQAVFITPTYSQPQSTEVEEPGVYALPLPATTPLPFDGFGKMEATAASFVARLMSSPVVPAPAPFRFEPRPRGAISSLIPVSLTDAAAVAAGGVRCSSGCALLSVKAVGINFRDVLNVLGMYPGDPGAPGSDVAGLVVQAGPDSSLQPGQAVFGLAEGCLGSHVLASAQTLGVMPGQVSFEAAATMPTVFITVDMVLHQAAGVQAGEHVLVHAAAGGVGLAALQVLQGKGARAVATAGSPAKRSLLRSLGVSAVVGSRDTEFASSLAGVGGVDVVLNSLTSPGMVAGSLSVLRQGGRFVEIGKRDIWAPAAVSADRPDVSYSLVAVDFMSASGLHAAMAKLSVQLAEGQVHPLPAAVHGLSDVAAALRQMSQARHVGKIVVSSFSGQSGRVEPASALSGGRVVVSGGTGALGTLVTHWLVSTQQVRHVHLISRSGRLSQAAAQQLLGLDAAAFSASVMVTAADTSTAEDMANAVAGPFGQCLAVSCFMHAGGVLADATLARQSISSIRQVSAPKTKAMLLWQQYSRAYPINHHVLFSSVASLLGSPGQSNYAAANASLDGLATQLAASGVPAVSVQWGAWAGGGMAAADAQTAARVERMGMSLISPAAGLAALEGVLGQGCCLGHAAVMAATPFIWDRFLQRFGRAVPGVFEEFAAAGVVAEGVSVRWPAASLAVQSTAAEADIQQQVNRAVAAVIGRQLDQDASLMESGLDSLGAVELRNALSAAFDLDLPATLTFDYPSINAISSFIVGSQQPSGVAAAAAVEAAPAKPGLLVDGVQADWQHALALTGVAIRASHINSLLELYSCMRDSEELHSSAPFSRWDVEAVHHPSAPHPVATAASFSKGQVATRFGTFLPDLHAFDAAAFNLSAAEAACMDVQQRLLLEDLSKAAADSGRSPRQLLGASGGVYVGCIWLEYAELLAQYNNPSSSMMVTGNGLAFMAGRLSYTFGLTGPCLPTNTACSSSLVAAHLAAVAVKRHECNFAAAAGANAMLLPLGATAAMTQVQALAPDGRCKSFAAEGDGYGRGEGFAVMILERAAAAADPAAIHALFVGSAVNQDGRSSGLTAPHGPSQAALVTAAMQQAGISYLSYVATHGTGTPLGDPIESGALARSVVSKPGAASGSPAAAGLPDDFVFSMGAVKTLVGHLEGTAGLAGLAQALVVLQQQAVMPLRWRNINPYVANSLENWGTASRIPIQAGGNIIPGLHAGTSSFGMSGVNAHAIISTVSSSLNASLTGQGTVKPSIHFSWQQKDMRIGVLPVGHPLLFSASRTNSKTASWEFQLRICNRPGLAWLWDHQVSGRVLLPGAAYLEMAVAALQAMLHNTGVSSSLQFALEGVVLTAPCLLSSLKPSTGKQEASPQEQQQQQQQLIVTCKLDIKQGTVVVTSRSNSSAAALSHMTSHTAHVETTAAGQAVEAAERRQRLWPAADALRAACREPMDATALYDSLAAANLHYGPHFKRLRTVVHDGNKQATATVLDGAAAGAATDATSYCIHPAALDGMLQLGAVVPEPSVSAGSRSAFVPASLKLFIPHRQNSGAAGLVSPGSSESRLTAYAARCESADAAAAALTAATHRDHALLDDAGQLVCTLQDLEARSIGKQLVTSPAALAVPPQELLHPEFLYSVQWVAADVEDAWTDYAEWPATKSNAAALQLVSPDAWRYQQQLHELGAPHAVANLLSLLQTMAAVPAASNPAYMALTQEAAATSGRPTALATPVSSTSSRPEVHAALKAALRSAQQEGPTAVTASRVIDTAAAPMSSETCLPLLLAMPTARSQQLVMPDGYGLAQAGGIIHMPKLQPSRLMPQLVPYQLLPKVQGSLSSLIPVPINTEHTAPETVLLSVKAVGINFRDVLNVLGMYPGDPGAPGSDVAGLVLSSNSSRGSSPSPGQSVFGLAEGCLGSHVLASAQTLGVMPGQVSFEAAATMPTVFITVDMVLHQAAGVQAGEHVLVHAAAGGVGLAALQVLQGKGARAVATAGSPAKRSLLRSLGVPAVVGSRDTEFASSLAGVGGVDVVLNSLTSPGMVAGSLSVLRQGGRFVEIGKRDIWAPAAVSADRPDVSYSLVAVDFMSASGLHAAMAKLSVQLAEGQVHPLPAAVHGLSNVAAALRQMSQARHIGKIVVRQPEAPIQNLQMIAVEGSVMIVGGTGTLGTLMVAWLSERRVNSFFIISRTGRMSTAFAQMVDSSAAQHAVVKILACDASTPADMWGLEACSAACGRPVVGVVHAGGVLADATISKQTLAGVRKVFAPKFDATVQLQRCLQHHPVSYQVLFSSVASLLGSPGQSNYAAANASLDGLATQLAASGVPAVSVQWGAWAGGGMAAADAQTAARVERMGMSLISPAAGLAALERVLGQLDAAPGIAACAAAVVTAVPFKWGRFLGSFGANVPELFSDVLEKGAAVAASQAAGPALSGDSIRTLVLETVSSILGPDINPDEPLMASGLDSLGAVELRNALQAQLPPGIELPVTLMFDYPSIAAISSYIAVQVADATDADFHQLTPPAPALTPVVPADARKAAAAVAGGRVIAVTAGACCSPCDAITSAVAVDAITATPLHRWDWDHLAASGRAASEVLPAASINNQQLPARFGGWLSNIELFDATAFGISSVEAMLMDVQQRLLLQLSWNALSAAATASQPVAATAQRASGLASAPAANHSSINVLHQVSGSAMAACVAVGIASAEYNNWLLRRTNAGQTAYSATGGALSVASGRLAFMFGMKGPALSVDTACSSSLVAAHYVTQQMNGGASLAGLAAGVGILLSPEPTSMFQKAGMLAPDGRCKTLDAAADGYVRAEAAGVLLMQAFAADRAGSALEHCLCLLAGSAVNQDGRSSSLTAPNGPAQQDVIRAALADGRHHPANLSGLQLHGTGTTLGDPIELGAAAAVLLSSPQDAAVKQRQPLLASAGKSWMGHSEAAAGAMGLIHALQGLGGQCTQPLLHLQAANPYLEGALKPQPQGLTAAWSLPRQSAGLPAARTAKDSPHLITGVSSFAFQGTNAHVQLAAAPFISTQGGGTVAVGFFGNGQQAWQHQRTWPLPPAHLLVTHAASSTSNQVRFDAQLTSPALSFLWDHEILQQVLVPSAALLEIASACVSMLLPDLKSAAAAATDERRATDQAVASSSSMMSLQGVVFAAPVRQDQLVNTVVSCVVSVEAGLFWVQSDGFLMHPAVLEASLQMQALCVEESSAQGIAQTPVVAPAAIRQFYITSAGAQQANVDLQFSGLLRQPQEGVNGSSMRLFDNGCLAAAVIDADFRPLVLEASDGALVSSTTGTPRITATSTLAAARQLQMSDAQVTLLVHSTVEAVLGQPVARDAPLMATGLDSLGATEVRNSLQSSLGLDLPAALTFDYPTVAAISGFIQHQLQPAAEASGGVAQRQQALLRAAVAAARPMLIMGASTPQWTLQDYAAGGDAVSLAPYWRWDVDSQLGQLAGPAEVPPRFGAFLPGVDLFDCSMYGITPLEASTLDPQQRLLLHATSEALQSCFIRSTGTSATAAAPHTGCFVGIGTNDYEVLASNAGVSVSAFSFTAASAAVASGRLAFVYDLHGPSASIDTACSASLVALHMAAASLADGSADGALVAGVLLCLVPQSTLMVQRAGMLADDGRCKVLDASSDGYVRGEACRAMFVQAVEDVASSAVAAAPLAVVLGSAVNTNGRASSLVAPHGPTQQELIHGALTAAGMAPTQVSGLQMHANGTTLGE
eukprot:gene7135-7350_t